jgi:hypothetical protein
VVKPVEVARRDGAGDPGFQDGAVAGWERRLVLPRRVLQESFDREANGPVPQGVEVPEPLDGFADA